MNELRQEETEENKRKEKVVPRTPKPEPKTPVRVSRAFSLFDMLDSN